MQQNQIITQFWSGCPMPPLDITGRGHARESLRIQAFRSFLGVGFGCCRMSSEGVNGGPCRDRTYDQLIKRRAPYPLVLGAAPRYS
jgi:hypothetical protein